MGFKSEGKISYISLQMDVVGQQQNIKQVCRFFRAIYCGVVNYFMKLIDGAVQEIADEIEFLIAYCSFRLTVFH